MISKQQFSALLLKEQERKRKERRKAIEKENRHREMDYTSLKVMVVENSKRGGRRYGEKR